MTAYILSETTYSPIRRYGEPYSRKSCIIASLKKKSVTDVLNRIFKQLEQENLYVTETNDATYWEWYDEATQRSYLYEIEQCTFIK